MRKLSDSIHGSAAMIGVVIAGLISIVIGVMVWYKLNSSVYASFKASTNTAAMNATYLGVNTTADTIWTLFPIVSIVVIAGVILAVVMGFGRQPV